MLHRNSFLLLKITIVVLACYLIKHFCEKQTDSFSVRQICIPSPFNPDWEIPLPNQDQKKDLHTILNQSFTYLDSGGQSFAFVSEDQKYVLKFFKTPTLATFFPPKNWQGNHFSRPVQKFIFKRLRDFGSYKLAFEELKKETGLIVIHLNPSIGIFSPVQILDKMGISHTIPLDSTCFILQKKAELLYPRLERLVKSNKPQEALKTLRHSLLLIHDRYQKGIYDEDPRLHKNIGFLEDEAIFIDVGRFKKDLEKTTAAALKKDLPMITERLRIWLQEHSPSLVVEFDREIDEIQKKL